MSHLVLPSVISTTRSCHWTKEQSTQFYSAENIQCYMQQTSILSQMFFFSFYNRLGRWQVCRIWRGSSMDWQCRKPQADQRSSSSHCTRFSLSFAINFYLGYKTFVLLHYPSLDLSPLFGAITHMMIKCLCHDHSGYVGSWFSYRASWSDPPPVFDHSSKRFLSRRALVTWVSVDLYFLWWITVSIFWDEILQKSFLSWRVEKKKKKVTKDIIEELDMDKIWLPQFH